MWHPEFPRWARLNIGWETKLIKLPPSKPKLSTKEAMAENKKWFKKQMENNQ